MKRGLSISTHILLVFGCALTVARCENERPRHSNQGHPESSDTTRSPAPLRKNPFTSQESLTPPAGILLKPNTDLFWALSRCQCAPKATQAYFQELAVSRGTLPQPLVPTIRNQIRGDSKLQILDVLPSGLSDLVSDFFANDDKIAGEIRAGVAEKIATFTPGRRSLADRLAFRFDGFPKLGARSEMPNEFDFADQIPRWHMAFALDSLWMNQPPLGDDHSLQTLETMRTLVEWQYMIGLEENPDGGFYGGLTLDVAQGGQTLAGPFDPRTDPQSARFFSGRYRIAFPKDVSSLDLATKAKETWSVNVGQVSLAEQSQLWHTAALAFKRLRPENRRAAAGMFGSSDQALFPLDTHQLPLAFLPGLGALLDGPLLNKETRLIRRFANLQDSGSDAAASLPDLAKLLAAMVAWTKELKNLDATELDQSTQDALITGRDAMLKAAQLTTQTILQTYTQPSKGYGIALQSKTGNASLTHAAETLMALVAAERDALDSPFLESRIVSFYHWFIGDVLAPRFNQNHDLTEQELLWAYGAIAAFAPYAGEHGEDWYAPVQKRLTDLLTAWDRSTP